MTQHLHRNTTAAITRLNERLEFVTTVIPTYWCDPCRGWTRPDPDNMTGDDDPMCSVCGEYYTCGECGAMISSSDGSCRAGCDD